MGVWIRLNVNLLSLVGAAAGIASILLPWIKMSVTPTGEHEIGGLDYLAGHGAMTFFCTIFLAASFLAFLSSFGGPLQLVGIAGFFTFAHEDIYGDLWSFEIGFYVGLLAAIATCVSLVVPLGSQKRSEVKPRNPLRIQWNDSLTVASFEKGGRLSTDYLSIGGACLGLMILAGPWIYALTHAGHIMTSSFGADVESIVPSSRNLFFCAVNQTMGLGPIIIIAGTALLFVSSLAVILLVGGQIVFYQAATEASQAGEIYEIGQGVSVMCIVVAMAAFSLASTLMRLKSSRRGSTLWNLLTLRVEECGKV